MRVPFLLAALVATVGAQAQQTPLKPFQESPAASVTQEMGSSSVKIDYHRPAVKGRKVWGALVPFGEVWRTGANEATTITFSDPVRIGDQTLAAGSYALFTIPGADTWTFVFNRTDKQWGAYNYKAEADALRIQAKPRPAPFQEYLGFTLQVTAPDRMRVDLGWENLAVGFDLSLDVRGLYWAYLEKTLAGAKAEEAGPFLQGANYCLSQNVHLDKGLEWVERSLKAKPGYRGLEVKARLLDKTGKRAEALPMLQKALELATSAKAPKDYLDRQTATLAEWHK